MSTWSIADKQAIDTALQKLCKAAGTKVKLPPASTDPAIGPFSHLREALAVMKRPPLLAKVSGFEDSWLDQLLAQQQHLVHFTHPTKEAVQQRTWRGITKEERAILAVGLGVRARGTEILVLSPAGPGAAVYVLHPQRLACVGGSVADFVHREVSRLLGERVTGPVGLSATGTETIARIERLAGLRAAQPPMESVHGALVYGYAFDKLKSAEDLFAIADFAKAAGLALFFGRGDAESATDDELAGAAWVVGRAVLAAEGGAEQKKGHDLSRALTPEARAPVDAHAKAARAVTAGRALTVGKPGFLLVARGGLCTATLVHGTWRAKAPAVIPGAKLATVTGTQGATQTAFPGAAYGIVVEHAHATFEAVALDARSAARREAKLVAAGIERPRYYLVTRHD